MMKFMDKFMDDNFMKMIDEWWDDDDFLWWYDDGW